MNSHYESVPEEDLTESKPVSRSGKDRWVPGQRNAGRIDPDNWLGTAPPCGKWCPAAVFIRAIFHTKISENEIWREVESEEATRIWCFKLKSFMKIGEDCCWEGHS